MTQSELLNGAITWLACDHLQVPLQKAPEQLIRSSERHLSSLKGLGGGLLECRLHFGPGYRIYLGRDGDALVILLAGGTKARQRQDIEKARGLWREYRRRRREEV